jgi:hypothetical protein
MTSPRLRLVPGSRPPESGPQESVQTNWAKGEGNLFYLFVEPSDRRIQAVGLLNDLVGRRLALLEKLRRNNP